MLHFRADGMLRFGDVVTFRHTHSSASLALDPFDQVLSKRASEATE